MGSRLRRYLAHARSRRFLAALIGVAALFVAIVTDGWVAWLFGIAGSAALLAFFFVISFHVANLQRRVSSLPRDLVDRSSVRLANTVATLVSRDSRAASTAGAGTPGVTVVIPCYNEERFVADAIESVRRQSFTDWECIVVDDASTDRSLKVISDAVAKDDRFRVLRHRVNSGLGASRNTGLRAARGRFITFLDSDDMLMGDSLLDRVIALSQSMDDPHVIGSYCGVRTELEDGTVDDLPAREGPNRSTVIDFISAGGECPFNAHAPLLLTDTVRRIGGFTERARHGAEDWELWYRILRNGYAFVPASSVTAIYRQKRNSMVRLGADIHMTEADRLITAAFLPADPVLFTLPSPTPFTEPIATYLELLRKSERAVPFAAMALVQGDESAARRILEGHPHLPGPVLRRHLDIGDLTARGMMRGLGIRRDELKQFGTSTAKVEQQLAAIIAETSDAAAIVDTYRPPVLAAALVPQHAGQLKQMLAAARDAGIDPARMAVVDVSREAGDQGVAGDLDDATHSMSLNEWVLQGHRAEAVMVGSMRVAAADQLARLAVAEGAKLIEVPQPHLDVMTIEAAHRPMIEPAGEALSLLGRPPGNEKPLDADPAEAWAIEESGGTLVDYAAIAGFRDRHRGERVVIIGNGPSLNDCDLTKLKGEHTIAVNAIFYAAERMGFDPTYYVVEDTAVMRDNVDAIKAYVAGHKFFPSIYRRKVGEAPNVSYFMMNRGFYEPKSPDFCVPKFSLSPEQRVFCGQSVTIINLQLAYFMGFAEVILIGMDFSYTIPDSAEVKGDLITSHGDDPNHFHPDYFGAGKVWKDPKLDRVLATYALAKQVFEADGRRIVNATKGGRLELFERVDYDSYIG
jgi:GT2 family glycosyltransferase